MIIPILTDYRKSTPPKRTNYLFNHSGTLLYLCSHESLKKFRKSTQALSKK